MRPSAPQLTAEILHYVRLIVLLQQQDEVGVLFVFVFVVVVVVFTSIKSCMCFLVNVYNLFVFCGLCLDSALAWG